MERTEGKARRSHRKRPARDPRREARAAHALLLSFILSVCLVPSAVGGIAPDPGETAVQLGDEQAKTRPKGDRKFDYVVAPIPIVNPLVGVGLTLAGGLVYRVDPNDNVSPPSITGVAGFYTNNGSYGAAVAQKLYLAEDRHRILAGVGYFSIRYDYYGQGTESGKKDRKVSLEQEGAIVGAEFVTRILGRLYAGPFYRYLPTRTRPDGGLQDAFAGFGITDPELDLDIGTLGILVQHDRRDNTFNPSEGHLFDLRAAFQDPAFGSGLTYQKYTASYNHYLGFSGPSVLAFRVAGCRAAGDVPFFDQCMVGAGSDIRGYPVGRYQDKAMLAGQMEYRRLLYKKVGGVLFGGVAEVAPTLGDFNSSDILPAGGVGLRYMASEIHRINLRADIAWGRDDTTFYVSVGEAF